MVELFAGLKRSHIVSAEVPELDISTSTAAQSCPFASLLAKKNNIDELPFKDARGMGQIWAIVLIAEARRRGCRCAFIIAGLSCNCTSQSRGANRPNLRDPFSILFEEVQDS